MKLFIKLALLLHLFNTFTTKVKGQNLIKQTNPDSLKLKEYKPEIEYALPIYQFSFNYSLKN